MCFYVLEYTSRRFSFWNRLSFGRKNSTAGWKSSFLKCILLYWWNSSTSPGLNSFIADNRAGPAHVIRQLFRESSLTHHIPPTAIVDRDVVGILGNSWLTSSTSFCEDITSPVTSSTDMAISNWLGRWFRFDLTLFNGCSWEERHFKVVGFWLLSS